MLKLKYQIIYKIADLMLPDLCALCGKSLSLKRPPNFRDESLCNYCLQKADEALVRKAYPFLKRCIICGYPLSSEEDKCCRCREKVFSFKASTSLFLYRGTGKDLITAYKFDNRKMIAGYLARKIRDVYFTNYPGYTVVPVPYRPSAKRQRGWDQVEVLTEYLTNNYNIPVSYCLKRKNGPPQKKMDYRKRSSNLKNQISLKKDAKPPKSVVLIDDVFTTGATIDCCAKILADNGTETVYCIAVALDL